MTKSPSSVKFKVIRLTPDASKDPRIVANQKTFRLASLQRDPDAFASSYDIEASKPDEYWADRLSNPAATSFIAVPVEGDVHSDWCGRIVLLGPNKTSLGANPAHWTTGSVGEGDAVELCYHVSGTAVAPECRRKGVARLILKEILRFAEEESRRANAALRVGVHVDTLNPAARALHEIHGFVVTGEEKYTPAPTKDGPRAERMAWVLEYRRPLGATMDDNRADEDV